MRFVITLLFCLSVTGVAASCAGTDPTAPASDAGETSQADTTDEDPCEGITCSGHGTCAEQSGGEVRCVCDGGYRPEGLSCVELDPDMPCDGVDCSGHGTCNVVEGEPSCACDDGYESGGDLICVEIDPCEGETCSGFGTCVLDNGNPRCDCDDGYVLSGDLACVEEADPCAGVACSGNGMCVVSGGAATCQCDARYERDGLACRPEDNDGDGEDFTTDCDDDDPSINSTAQEVCDQVDNNCNNQVDEGQACGIWVLEPGSPEWDAYPMDPAASANAPSATIRAAWDIESEDRAYVLTDAGYHVLRINTLSWQSQRSLTEIGDQLDDVTGAGTFAYTVPSSDGSAGTESVTIVGTGASGTVVWALEYDISNRSYTPSSSLYNEPFSWDDADAPDPADVRASWLDLDNTRGWMDANPSQFCDTQRTSIDRYVGFVTGSRMHLQEAGICVAFTHNLTLAQSPLSQPANPPPFDEIGAAFWHQGALYLFRGD